MESRKRETAYKLRVVDVLRANPIYEESESLNKKLMHLELGNKNIKRVNLIANIVDKFESQGESKFATITLDDGSGQVRARVFGEELDKFKDITQGDTVVLIGIVRAYNQEVYLLPEVLRKQDPKYLLIRKLEIEKSYPKELSSAEKKEIKSMKDEVLELIKTSEEQGGIDKEEIVLKIKSEPSIVNQEIQKLLEEGIIYEPKPGIVRYLG